MIQLRRRETALILLETLLRYGVILVAILAIVSIFVKDTTTALSGGALVVLLVAFSAQRFLYDVSAGLLILFEGLVRRRRLRPHPAGQRGGHRRAVQPADDGRPLLERRPPAHLEQSDPSSVARAPSGYRRYSIELLTRDPEEVSRAIEGVSVRAPADGARFLRPPEVIEEREVGDGIWLIRARADVPPTLEWLAESLLTGALKQQLDEADLLTEPIVYTLDEGALSRYERRVVVR